MDTERHEIAFYREVEDFFAAARGVPHTLSPRDVQLLRSWWRDEIPLQAVTAGIAEVLARRRESGNDDPTVSLNYCRHAVRRQAKQLAAMRVGQESTQEEPSSSEGVKEALEGLRRRLLEAATHAENISPTAGSVIVAVAGGLDNVAELDMAALDQHLFNLETTLMEGCTKAMPDEERARLHQRAQKAAAASGATGDAMDRALRAMMDREIRELFSLPRLQLI